jgi:DNA-binding IclR family transcriptional regulator
VLVAFAEPSAREYLVATLPLPPAGPRAITSRQKFRAEIDLVRESGYAVADEEHEAGIRAIGVPVLDDTGVALAAIATAAPAYRMTVEQLEGFLPTLREAASAIAVLMALR